METRLELCVKCKKPTQQNVVSTLRSDGVEYKKATCTICKSSRAVAKNSNPEEIIMPIGVKYKGVKLKEIPVDYLEYCLTWDISNNFKNKIKKVIESKLR